MAAAARHEAVTAVLDGIFHREPGITGADVLYEFTHRVRDGRNFRITKRDAAECIKGKECYQVYKRVPAE